MRRPAGSGWRRGIWRGWSFGKLLLLLTAERIADLVGEMFQAVGSEFRALGWILKRHETSPEVRGKDVILR